VSRRCAVDGLLDPSLWRCGVPIMLPFWFQHGRSIIVSKELEWDTSGSSSPAQPEVGVVCTECCQPTGTCDLWLNFRRFFLNSPMHQTVVNFPSAAVTNFPRRDEITTKVAIPQKLDVALPASLASHDVRDA
jgi:hypothetical protein